MNNNSVMEGLTYDDVLLLPGYTDFKRQEVSLETVLHPNITLKLPIISSPMDTVSETAMARSLAQMGGLGIIHRNLTIGMQVDMVKTVHDERLLIGAAAGVGSDFEDRVKALISAGVDVLVIDSGHGNTKFVVESVSYIKKIYPQSVVMAGNVATVDGAKRLVQAGVDILRVGMGPGSICITRIITGMGVPQLTAISEAVKAIQGTHVTIVADGGIRQIGDMAKALAVGAHAVMLGSLLAGFDESPGEKVMVEGKEYKQYRGMGSIASMTKGSAERYGQVKDDKGSKLIAEGVEGLVRYKGTVSEYLMQVAGSLRSSFYYVGAKNLTELQEKATFIKITPASLIESHPHSILISETGNNYTAS